MKEKLLIIFFILFAKITKSQHIIGGDLYFEKKTNHSVDVYFMRYRLLYDKDTSIVKIGLNIGNNLFYQNAILQDKNYLTAYCNKVKFNNYDTVSPSATKAELFKTTFDLTDKKIDSLISKFCNITFFNNQGKRGYMTTIDLNTKFYIESQINICKFKNVDFNTGFSNDPQFTGCCNQTFAYNCGYNFSSNVIDSFSFELVNVQDSINRNLRYNDNFSGKIPVQPFCPPNPGVINCKPLPNAIPSRGLFFDKIIGDLILTPTDCSQSSVICIRINYFKLDSMNNFINIGYISREMYFLILQCSDNNFPRITNSVNKYTICEGQKICFDISSTDLAYLPNQTIKDTVSLTWDKAIPNATLTIKDITAREKTAQFCWQTKIGDGRNAAYHFTALAVDNYCNFEGKTSKGFNIIVKENTKKLKKEYNILICHKLALKAFNTKYKSIKWEIYNQNNSLVATSSKFIDTVLLTAPFTNKYFIKSRIDNDNICTLLDTITNIKYDNEYFNTIDTNICQSNNVLKLDNFNQINHNNVKWFDENMIELSNKTISLKGLTFPTSLSATYSLFQNNCKIETIFSFNIYDTIRTNIFDINLCKTTQKYALFESNFNKKSKGFFNSKPYFNIANSGIININNLPNYFYSIKYFYDSMYCQNYEFGNLIIEPEVKADFIVDKDKSSSSYFASFTYTGSSNSKSFKWNFGDNLSNSNNSILKNPSHYYDSFGNYNVTLISKGNLCEDTMIKPNFIQINNPLSIYLQSFYNFILYPNPSNGFIHISCDKIFNLEISNILGQNILKAKDSNKYNFVLDKGVYILKYEIENHIFNKKIVIQ